MCDLCQYKDTFGEPGKGLHSYRIFNIAIVDVIFTILAGYLLSFYIGTFRNNVIFLFLLGILLHKIFCVDTTINKLIFN